MVLRKTRMEGEHILQEAQEKTDSRFEKHKAEFNAVQEKKLSRFEQEKEEQVKSIQELQSKVDKKFHQLKLKKKEREMAFNRFNKNIQQVQQEEKNNIQQKDQLRAELQKCIQDKIKNISDRFSINLTELKENLKAELEQKWTDRLRKELKKQDEHNRENLQKDSFFYLNTVFKPF